MPFSLIIPFSQCPWGKWENPTRFSHFPRGKGENGKIRFEFTIFPPGKWENKKMGKLDLIFLFSHLPAGKWENGNIRLRSKIRGWDLRWCLRSELYIRDFRCDLSWDALFERSEFDIHVWDLELIFPITPLSNWKKGKW